MENQHFTPAAVARLCGIKPHNLAYMRRCGEIPHPVVPVGSKMAYSVEQVQAIFKVMGFPPDKKVEEAESELISLPKTAKLLGVPVHILYYRVSIDSVPTPDHFKPHTAGKQRYYSRADLPALREALAKPAPVLSPSQQLAEQGLYSVVQAAEQLGIPKITLQMWVKTGAAPRPTHGPDWWRHKRYNRADLAQIKKQHADYFKKRKANAKK